MLSLGQRLRQRRESKGISLEAAMRATKMTRAVIQSLEEDRFTDLAAPVYVRGFLRIYAQFLEMSPDHVLDSYEAQVNATDKVADLNHAPVPEFLRTQERAPSGMTPTQSFMLVAVAVIAFVFLWSVNRTRKPVQVASRPGVSTPATASGPQGTAAVPNARRPVPGKDVLTDKPTQTSPAAR